MSKYCMYCGFELPNKARFCINCGTGLDGIVSKNRVQVEDMVNQTGEWMPDSVCNISGTTDYWLSDKLYEMDAEGLAYCEIPKYLYEDISTLIENFIEAGGLTHKSFSLGKFNEKVPGLLGKIKKIRFKNVVNVGYNIRKCEVGFVLEENEKTKSSEKIFLPQDSFIYLTGIIRKRLLIDEYIASMNSPEGEAEFTCASIEAVPGITNVMELYANRKSKEHDHSASF